MRRARTLLVVLPVLVSVLASGSPTFAAADPAESSGPGPAAVAPVPDRFTPYAHVTTSPEGQARATIYQLPAFTQFGDGRWRRADNRVRPRQANDLPEVAFRADEAYRPLTFGRNANNLVAMQLQRGPVRMSAVGLRTDGRPELTEDGVLHRDVATDTDLTIRPSGAGFRSVLRLKSAQAPTSFRWHLSDPTGQLGTPTRTEEGGYEFSTEVDADVRLQLRPAYAYEVDTDPPYTPGAELGSATLAVTRAGDGYDIVKTVDPNWLEGRTFPIELDPLVSFGRAAGTSSRDCHMVNATSPVNLANKNYCPTDVFEVGYGSGTDTGAATRRMVAQYSLGGAVPSDALVHSGVLSLYMQRDFHSRSMNVGAWETGDAWTSAATWYNKDGSNPWTTRAGNPIPSWPSSPLDSRLVGTGTSCPQNTRCTWSLTPLVRRWVTGAAPQNGVTLTMNTESTATQVVMAFASQENAGNWPYLQVDYTPKPTAPQNLSAGEGDGSATVYWAAPANAAQSAPTQYTATAYVAATGAWAGSASCGSGCTSVPIFGLTNGAAYTFAVTASNAAGTGPAGVTPAGVMYSPFGSPGTPPNVRTDTAAPGPGAVTVAWDPSAGNGRPVTAYTARLYNTSGSYLDARACSGSCLSSRNVTFTGLTNGTTYLIGVTAYTDSSVRNTSTESSRVSAVPYDRPGIPTGVTGDPSVAANAVRVSWQAPPNNGSTISSNTVRAYTGSGGSRVLAREVACPSTSPCTITSLSNGTPYVFTVVASNARGAGGESAESPAAVPYGLPSAPTGVAADVTVAPGQARVTWAAPSSDGGRPVSSYVVRAYSGSGAGRTLATGTSVNPSPCTSSPCTISGLTNGTSYVFTVAAVNLRGEGPPSTDSAPQTPYGLPGTPSNVAADVSTAPGQARISWTAPSDNGRPISSYVLRAYTGSGASRQAVTGTSISPTPCTASPCTVSGLTNGTAYVFTVAAVNQRGEGAQSAEAAGTPYNVPSAPIPGPVEDGDSSVTVTWQPPASTNGSPITGYSVWEIDWISLTPNGEPQELGPEARAATFGALENGQEYYYELVAKNARGQSTSVYVGPGRPYGAPDAPALVNATARTSEVDVTWTPPLFDGGRPVLGYTVTLRRASDNVVVGQPQQAADSSQPVTFTAVPNGISYYATVQASNARGTGLPRRSTVDVTPYAPVAVVKTINGQQSSYSPGDLVTYTVTLNNSNVVGLTGVVLTDTADAGLRVVRSSVTGNALCTSAGAQCTVSTDGSGRSVTTIRPTDLPTGLSTLTYTAEVTAGTRACQTLTNAATITDPLGLRPVPGASLLACDAGLGLESWWSTQSVDVGPQSVLSVNVANGNTVLQATDSTPIQARGRLAYVLRRTYNSSSRPTVALPGSLGAGWTFNVGEVDDAAGISTAGSALIVPSLPTMLDTVSNPLGVTLVDRDGTRHTFTPRAVTATLAATSPAGPGVFEARKPANTTLCVDVAYTAPKGVHLGLWRYVATSSSDCSLTAADNPIVVGFAAVRPDRLRTDYDLTGRLLEMTDGSGVSLRYLYGQPTSGPDAGRLTAVYEPRSCPDAPASVTRDTLPSTCRSFRFDYSQAGPTNSSPAVTVSDPADRTTTYQLDKALPTNPTDPAAHLIAVINDDGSTVQYRYGGCGGSPDQLCEVIDPRNASTQLTYTAGHDPLGSPARTTTVTDRRGTTWSLSYPSSSRTLLQAANTSTGTAADKATPGRQHVFTGIDADGRVALREDYDLATGERLHKTAFGWDSAACRLPDGVADNNLCAVQRTAAGKSTPGPDSSGGDVPDGSTDERTEYLYTSDGQLLRERRVLPGQNLDTTHGYSTQYVTANGTIVATDTVTGAGGHTMAGTRGGPGTLFTITDRVQTLSPRGNSPAASSGWTNYLTSYVVDNDPTQPVNTAPASGSSCATTADPSRPNDTPVPGSNTGALCQTSAPNPTGQGVSITRAVYDSFGQKASATSAKAIADTPLEQTPPATNYGYFTDGSTAPTDVSGTVRIGGWLRDVTDPTGQFVAFDYDAAGNTVRTWDRDATSGHSPQDYPGTLTTPRIDPTLGAVPGQYAEARYGTGPTAFSRPWRYLRASTDPLGQRTELTVDDNGNPLMTRPPRGTADNNGAGSSSFDITRTFDAGDLLLTEATPLQVGAGTATRHGYDPFGNLTSTRGPDSGGDLPGRHATVIRYDAADRQIATLTSRGPAASAGSDCAIATAEHAPLVAGEVYCRTSSSYDHLDNQTVSSDGNGVLTRTSYDAAHRPVEVRTPRGNNDISEVRAAAVYDLDGHLLRICTPRHFTEGAGATSGSCNSDALHATHHTYNPAGLPVSITRYRDSGQPLTSTVGYDPDGNQVSSTDPRVTAADGTDVTVRSSFDLLGRRTSTTVPRAGMTRYVYSPSGDLLATAAPGTSADNPGGPAARISATSYDAAHRPIDTVQALQLPELTVTAVQTALSTAVSDADQQTNLRSRVGYDPDGNITVRYSPRAFTGTGQTGSLAALTAPDERFAARTSYDRDGRAVTELQPRADAASNSTNDLTGDASQRDQCRAGTAPYPADVHVCRTDREYDAAGNLLRVLLPTRSSQADSTRSISYEYTHDNLLAAVTTPDPSDGIGTVSTAQYTFDGAGRVVTDTNAAGHTRTVSYTSDGLVAAVTGPTGRDGLTHITRTRYNADGQPVMIETPRSTFETATGLRTGSDTPITVVDYYADGLTRAVTTGRTLSTLPQLFPTADLTISYSYDKAGNATAVTSAAANANEAPNPVGEPVRHTWTADNLLAAVTTPVQVTATSVTQARLTQHSYDPAGRKTSTAVELTGTGAASGGTQSFSYYPTDRLAEQTGRGGQQHIQHTYDATGNPLTATDSTSSSTITGSYYLDGLPRAVDADNRRTAYAYDGTGALATRADGPVGGTLTHTRVTRNDAGLPQSVNADGGLSNYRYNPLGQPTRLDRPNGQVHAWTYDPDDLLASTTVSTSTGTALARWDYTYDELNRILAQSYTGTGAAASADPGTGSGPVGSDGNTVLPVTYRSTYDTAGRLASFTDARGTRTVQFDRNHNRLVYGQAGQPDPSSWTYRADDSIATSTTGVLLTSTTRTSSYHPFGGLANDGCTNYSYDAFDRLTTTSPGGCPGSAVQYSYDGLDRQTRRTTAGATTTLTYDGWTSAVTNQHSDAIGGTALHHTLDATGRPITASKGTAREYLVDDGTGSIGLAVLADQTVRCLARYDAYGNQDGNSLLKPTGACASGSSHNDMFYRGQRRDSITGNYQLGSRTYDPSKAGFLTPDSYRTAGSNANASIGIDPLTRNTYAYVNGDPLNFSDPSGHRLVEGDGGYAGVNMRRLPGSWLDQSGTGRWRVPGSDRIVGKQVAYGCSTCNRSAMQQQAELGGRPVGDFRDTLGGFASVGYDVSIGLIAAMVDASNVGRNLRHAGLPGAGSLAATGKTRLLDVAGVDTDSQSFRDARVLGTVASVVGGPGALRGATVGARALVPRLPTGRVHVANAAEAGGGVASTTTRLQGHVGRAVVDFESGAISMSARQARAVGRNPDLKHAYRGQVIDSAVKYAVRNDSELSHLWVSRSGEFGPDFHDIGTGTWWDVTTPGQWLNHVDSYTDPFGAGIGLFTR